MTSIPNWMEDQERSNTLVKDENPLLLRISLLYGIVYKILFSVAFALIIIYGSNFSFSYFINKEFNILKIFLGVYLCKLII